MKQRTIPLIFVIVAIFLALTFFITKNFSEEEDSLTRARIITPQVQNTNSLNGETNSNGIANETFDTFIQLLPGETLISVLTLDINNDNFDDEIAIVRKTSSAYMWIIVGIYNTENSIYERIDEIQTEITRTRTFSYSGMDITGNHRNELIYQGETDSGTYVMKIYSYENNQDEDSKKLKNIGEFFSDGTIFIQQTERSESYELSLTNGEAFSVWVYKSENFDENSAGLDSNQNENSSESNSVSAQNSQNQIQQEYKWNYQSQTYELNRQIKVAANRLAARELSRIQDGTVETFASFLNGLWYKTSNTDSNIRYLYFDYATKQIILLLDDSQEIYEWEDSRLRHNGIYLTSVNSSITTLHRRFDVALVNVDEIKITIRDDINLVIKENNLWDGNYKKLAVQEGIFSGNNVKKNVEEITNALTNSQSWKSSDGISEFNFSENKYSIIQNGTKVESGVFASLVSGSYNIIQFRSDSFSSLLNENYAAEFGQKTISENVQTRTRRGTENTVVEKIVTDYDTIIFTPVKVTPSDSFSAEGRIITLSKNELNELNELNEQNE